jgi:predicted PurR-regulated permease PerM
VNRAVIGYMLGNVLTSIIAGLVVFVTLMLVQVPYPLLWGLWVALVDFLPMIGGALAGIPTVLFAFGVEGIAAGVVTLVVFLVYTQVENHILNPVIMSRTVKINPLLVLLAVLVGASLGSLIGGLFGGFVAALLAIPIAGALQVLVREAWQATAAPRARAADDAEPQSAEPQSAEPAPQGPQPLGTAAAPAPVETVAELQVDLFPVPTDTREHGP